MITIQKSPTADTRTCDVTKVTQEMLRQSSVLHIRDVVHALEFFRVRLAEAARVHDWDKITLIDKFHEDFVTGFKQTTWWDNHRHIHRHHLAQDDGIPKDVNLVDVIEYVCDCVMAGMARSGSVTELKLSDEVLQRAFRNTVELLKKEVEVEDHA